MRTRLLRIMGGAVLAIALFIPSSETQASAVPTNLYGWGSNTLGRNGLGLSSGSTNVPTLATTTTGWTEIAGGQSHTMAVRDGQLYAWGTSNYGQTGTGTTSNVLVPTIATTTTGWTALTGAVNNSAAIRDGQLYTWGSNANGVTGLGTDSGNSLVPTLVDSSTGWTDVDIAISSVAGVRDGQLYTWGSNAGGLTGLGTTVGTTLAPTLATTTTGWTTVSLGENNQVLGIRNGQLYGWGINTNGSTGLGTSTGNTIVPTLATTTTGWTHVATGGYGSAGIRDGQLYTWGAHTSGSTGLGLSSGSVLVPTLATTTTGWTAIQMHWSSIALRDRQLYTWGSNSSGITGLNTASGSTTVPTLATTTDMFRAVAITSTGAFALSGPDDSVAPTVSLTAPAASATVSGASVTLSADAEDEMEMGGVRFYIDGVAVGSEDAASPYSVTWDSTTVSSGSKSLTAVARDAAGNTTTSASRTITVSNVPAQETPVTTATTTGATIAWNTDLPGSTRIFFGLVSPLATSTPETNTGGGRTSSHSVSLGDLPSCAFYRYQTVNNTGSDIATSTERTFQTACTGSSTISTSTSETIDVSTGGSVSHGIVTLGIPAGLTATTSDLTFQINTLDALSVITAVGAPDDKTNVSGIYHLKAIYDEAEMLNQFDESVEVTLSYDGVTSMDEDSLFLGRYADGQWHTMFSVVDTLAKTVTATTSVDGASAFSDWGIFGDELPEAEAEEDSSSSRSSRGSSGTSVRTRVANLERDGNTERAQELMREWPALFPETPAVTATGSSMPVRDLELGATGEDVRALQRLLNANGYPVAATGPGSAGSETSLFGPFTRAAVAAYQTAHNVLPSAGYFGPLTRASMDVQAMSLRWW